MLFKELLRLIHLKFGIEKFKAADVYRFYTADFPSVLLQGKPSPNLSDSQKHHAVVDLRKLHNMGFLLSRSYKGRWQEYWMTRKGQAYLEYLARPYEERLFDMMMKLVATLTPEEREFVREYQHKLELRTEAGIELFEKLDERRYSAKEKRLVRMIASSNLARKYKIPLARQEEIVDKLSRMIETK